MWLRWWWFPVGCEFFGFEWVVDPGAPGTGTGLGALEQDEHLAHVVTPLAIVDLLLTRSIYPSRLGIDRPLVSNLAASARNPQRLLSRPAALAGSGRGTRRPHLREQLRPGGCGGIDPYRRRRPDDVPVGLLFVTQSPPSAIEGLEPVVAPNC